MVSLEGKRVLEVGCGTGRLTAFAAKHAAFVYAFDPSVDSIAEAEAALDQADRHRVQFAVHDAQAIDVPRRRFPQGLLVDTQPLSAELVETVSDWGGTCAPSELARQLAAAGPAQLHQDVRLRVLRAL